MELENGIADVAATAANEWRRKNWGDSLNPSIAKNEPNGEDLRGLVCDLQKALDLAVTKSATALQLAQDAVQKLNELRSQKTLVCTRRLGAMEAVDQTRDRLEIMKVHVSEMEKELDIREMVLTQLDQDEVELSNQERQHEEDSVQKTLELESNQVELRRLKDGLAETTLKHKMTVAKDKMESAAEQLNFEEAAKFRDLIRQLENGNFPDPPPSPTPSDSDTIVPETYSKTDVGTTTLSLQLLIKGQMEAFAGFLANQFPEMDRDLLMAKAREHCAQINLVASDGRETVTQTRAPHPMTVDSCDEIELEVEERQDQNETYYVDPTNGDIYDIEECIVIGKWEGCFPRLY